jgi:hypothetical protein
MKHAIIVLPILAVACTSIPDTARQSWQESRQICDKIKATSERDFCKDMAWDNYMYVLRSYSEGRANLAADGETRHAQDELRDLRSQMDDLKFQMDMNKYESW